MTNVTRSAEQCAALALDLAPMLMSLMRQELNAHQTLDLSVPQFRTLRFVARQPAASLSNLAAHLGMTLPAASKLVDRLFEQELVTRTTATTDRRRVELTLTVRGKFALDLAVITAQARLAEQLADLPEQALDECIQALTVLRTCVVPISRKQEERT